jgi:hypothetical protein
VSKFDSWRFHRALRKCLDSKASSIVWNAIYLLQDNDWEKFCDDIEHVTGGSFGEVCEASLFYGEPARNLFLIGLSMLTEEELEVLERYSCEDKGMAIGE